MIADKIKQLSLSFDGLLAEWIIDSIADYVEAHEWGVAIHMLCEQLYEFDIPLSQAQWLQIDEICTELKMDVLEDYDWSMLKVLVIDSSP